jgi:hypothetical protein
MRILFIKIRPNEKGFSVTNIITFFVLLFFCCSVYSRTKVLRVQGESFVKKNKQLEKIHFEEELSDFSEIFTEAHSQLDLLVNDHLLVILAPNTQIKMMNKIIELHRGNLWIKKITSPQTDVYAIHTSNAIAEMKDGEGIVSFDVDKGKTQLVILESIGELSHLLNREASAKVSQGMFSFVEGKTVKHQPRSATPIGEKSYEDLVSIFLNRDTIEMNKKYSQEGLTHEDEISNPSFERKLGVVDSSSTKGNIYLLSKKKKTSFPLSQFLSSEIHGQKTAISKKREALRKKMLYGKTSYRLVIYKKPSTHSSLPQPELQRAGNKKETIDHRPQIEEVMNLLQELKKVQTP